MLAVEVQVALHEAPVGRHQPPFLRRRQIPVRVGEAPQRRVRHRQDQQEAAQHRQQRQIVLLRIAQAGLVDIVQPAQHPPLQPEEQPAQRRADQGVQPPHPAPEKALGDGRREDQFPQGGGGETLAVAGQQPVQKGGAAAWHTDHEQRLAHAHPAEVGKQQVIEHQPGAVDRLQQHEQRPEQRHHQPAARRHPLQRAAVIRTPGAHEQPPVGF